MKTKPSILTSVIALFAALVLSVPLSAQRREWSDHVRADHARRTDQLVRREPWWKQSGQTEQS
jgi:hypothetical protein